MLICVATQISIRAHFITIFCFDAIVERELNLEKLNADSDALLKIADKQNVQYDGWGTYFMPRGDDEDEYEDDYLED